MRIRCLQHFFHPASQEFLSADLPAWATDVKRFCAFWYSDEPFWEAQTSGSTSAPQKIRLSRQQLEDSARKSLDYFRFSRENEGFALVIPARSAGGFMLLARAFMADMDVLLLPPSLQKTSEIEFPEDKKWFLPLLPLQLHDFLARPDAGKFSRQLCGVLLGGGMLDEKLLPSLKLLHCPVFHSYGMTETASHIAIRQIAPETEAGFRPLPGIHLRLDENNCLEIRAEILTHDQWLATRDRAEILLDGSFRILGRADFTINSGGLKIQPETEKQLLQKIFPPEYCDFDLLSIPDQRLGEKMVMAAYFHPSCLSHLQEILSRISDPLLRQRLPKEVYFFPEGPLKLPGGKTDFSGLRNKILDILAQKKRH